MNQDAVNRIASAAQKGDVISFATVVAATGVRQDAPDAFRLACLALKEGVEQALRLAGHPAVVRVTREGLRVLTDAEAARYTAHRYAVHRRGMRRSHRKATEVDVSNLTPAEIAVHERNVCAQSRQIQAMRRAALPPLRAVGATN